MLDEDTKTSLARELNFAIGVDITNLVNAIDVENELVLRRNRLQSCLNVANDEVPTKLLAAVRKTEESAQKVNKLKEKSEAYKAKVEAFLEKTAPVRTELSQRFSAIERLEEIHAHVKSLERIEDINRQLKVCSDDEQAVLLYGQLQELCSAHTAGHRAVLVADITRHWHNVLKDRLSKQYEEVLKAMKWPQATGQEPHTPTREVVTRFNSLTKYLFLIQDTPKTPTDSQSDACLPVKLLLRPLKKRFAFHFTGPRQTARIDRPEWFLTQTLTWIKDHANFIKTNVQPIADKLEIKNVKAGEEFNAGLVSLAAERLHTVLGLYNTQAKESMDFEALFAHAIDEALGFHRELCAITGKEINTALAVLTRAETFVRWLAVEKKYALAKMDETLGSEQWMEPVGAGVESAAGALLWVPQGAEWFVTLLKTIEDRYTILPQPGHRLQFLELQLELVEEWRVRLTQLLSASCGSLEASSLLAADSAPHPLTAAINAGHHTRTALLQWAHSLHYLQLHYYRRQFQHFTDLQHSEDTAEKPDIPDYVPEPGVLEQTRTEYLVVQGDEQLHTQKSVDDELDDSISLIEVEVRANKLAMNEVSRRDSLPLVNLSNLTKMSTLMSPIEDTPITMGVELEDSGVFGELPALLAHLRDSGLITLADHIFMEFKAGLRDYRKQRWHAMCVMEERALSVCAALCQPLACLCARLHAARLRLAPALYAKLRAQLAAELDTHLLEEVVLENWWNSGGISQFTHDVKRNLVPVFAPPDKPTAHNLPRLCEACGVLNMDYDDAQRLRGLLQKGGPPLEQTMLKLGIKQLLPQEVLQILNQRTDLNDNRTSVRHQSVMEYF